VCPDAHVYRPPKLKTSQKLETKAITHYLCIDSRNINSTEVMRLHARILSSHLWADHVTLILKLLGVLQSINFTRRVVNILQNDLSGLVVLEFGLDGSCHIVSAKLPTFTPSLSRHDVGILATIAYCFLLRALNRGGVPEHQTRCTAQTPVCHGKAQRLVLLPS